MKAFWVFNRNTVIPFCDFIYLFIVCICDFSSSAFCVLVMHKLACGVNYCEVSHIQYCAYALLFSNQHRHRFLLTLDHQVLADGFLFVCFSTCIRKMIPGFILLIITLDYQSNVNMDLDSFMDMNMDLWTNSDDLVLKHQPGKQVVFLWYIIRTLHK